MFRRCAAVSLVTLFAVACIHVVVNVYFPESEAKGALATLEDELLKGSPAKPAPKPDSPQPPPSTPKPQSFWLRAIHPEQAFAAELVTEELIYNRIKSMPEVLEAYQRMAARLARVDALRQSGSVGEANNGLLVPKARIEDRRDERTISDENGDRTLVIRGLAKATLLAQGLPLSDENLAKVMPDAAGTFAALRRDKAKPGWWIQLPGGSWTHK